LSLVDRPERGQDGYKKAKDFVKELCLGKKGEVDIDDGQRRGG
jgi:micrococcal nuclease